MIDLEFQDYCDRVESEFFRQKARTGVLSPRDFALVKNWFESGVPLRVVLEGIDDAFGAQSAGRAGGTEEVNSLSFCESFVERALDRRRPNL